MNSENIKDRKMLIYLKNFDYGIIKLVCSRMASFLYYLAAEQWLFSLLAQGFHLDYIYPCSYGRKETWRKKKKIYNFLMKRKEGGRKVTFIEGLEVEHFYSHISFINTHTLLASVLYINRHNILWTEYLLYCTQNSLDRTVIEVNH